MRESKPTLLHHDLIDRPTSLHGLAFVLSIALAHVAGAQELPRSRQAHYFEGRQRVAVEIRLDQIALLVRPEVRDQEAPGEGLRDAIRSAAPLVATQPEVAVYPGGLAVVGLGERREVRELLQLARAIEQQRPETVVRAGLAVELAGAAAPMLLSRDLVVQFERSASREAIEASIAEHGVRVLMVNPFVENQFLLEVPLERGETGIEMANRYHGHPLVEYAHPNFARAVEERQTVPDDPLFVDQWHHDNAGASGGTVDADIDSPLAWDLTQGDPAIVAAVVDSGFDAAHPDLVPNLWANPGETVGNAADDDGNGYVDDAFGWDFTGCDVFSPPAGCGDAEVTGGNHGTSVAGLVAARGDNALGVSGACPRCRLMLIRLPATDFAQGLAFGYLRTEGARVSTNSWGFAVGTPCATSLCTAIDAAAAAGVLVLFAMNNGDVDDCVGADISSLASVMAISATSNQDRKVTESGFGNCMELLGPTHRGYGGGTAFTGTLNVATTDRVGTAGYNDASPPSAPCPSTEPTGRDYTLCFGGTSAATPTTAGVAALALSGDGTLTRQELARLLQDTADKVQDTAGSYAAATGFSSPAAGNATHGWGRVNSFEAVRVAASISAGGRGGRDIFIRDNRLDWGNTEQPSHVLMEPARGFIPHWESVDIKVDAPPDYQPAPTTAAEFEALVDENPRAEGLNRVYVRVRNRGPRTLASVSVKLHWAFAGTALPALPADFWTAFPGDSADTTTWHPLGVQPIADLAYSGASAAGCPGRLQPPCEAGLGDAARIVAFDFPGPALDLTRPEPRHYCLLAIVDSPQDGVSDLARGSLVLDWITPRDNNVTHRNVRLEDPSRSDRFEERFFVRNPTDRPIQTVLRARTAGPWQVRVSPVALDRPFDLGPGEQVLATVVLEGAEPGAGGTVTLEQSAPAAEPPFVGGLTFLLAVPEKPTPPKRRPAWSLHAGVTEPHGRLGRTHDSGLAATLDLTWPLKSRLDAVLRAGYSSFDAKPAAGARRGDLEIWDLTGGLEWRFVERGALFAVLGAGAGAYSPSAGDVEAGGYIGLGVGWRLGAASRLLVSYEEHDLVTASPHLRFAKGQLGLVVSF